MISTGAILRRTKFWWNLIIAYLSRYKIWIIASGIFLFLIFFSSVKILSYALRSNVLTVGFVGVYTLQSIPSQTVSLVTQPLISADNEGRPVPQLASHWTSSDDGKTYIVFLKDNLEWHDQTQVQAKDISIALSGVKITALNNKAIEFELPNPIPSFPLLLDKPVFKSNTFYGTGDYRIVDIDRVNNQVKMITLVPKKSGMPRVEIKFYATEESALNALKIGEIKSAAVAEASSLINWPNLEVEQILDSYEQVSIFYNNTDPLTASKEIRQALSYAINRAQFDGQSAISPFAPGTWAYYDSIKRYEYNLGKAKELLDDAKSPSKNIKLTTTSDLEKIAQSIKEDWEVIGINVEIEVVKSIPENFQAFLAVNHLNPDPDQYSLWHSTQNETNITNYKNVKVDKLLEDGRAEKTEEDRLQHYLEFQKVLVEDAPVTFLFHPYKYKVTYKNAKALSSKLPNLKLF